MNAPSCLSKTLPPALLWLLAGVAAAPSASAQWAATVALTPTQNASINQANPSTNYAGTFGGQDLLYVCDASGAVNQAYLQYDLSSLAGVQKAKLRFFVDTSTAASNISVYAVGGSSPNSWTESGLTYNGAAASWPAATGSGPLGPPVAVYPVASCPVKMPARYYEVDVTAAVVAAYGSASQAISFVVANDSSGLVEFDSGEGIRPPQLIVTTAALPAADNTYIDEVYPSHDNGSSATTSLAVKGSAGYEREAYLKFDLSSIMNASSAKLRIYVNSATAATTITANSVGGGTPNGWLGDGTGYLDWSDAGPYPLGSALGSASVGTTPGYYEIDVTSLAQASLGGQMSVILTAPADGTFTQFYSRFGTYPPQLILGTTSTVWAPGSQNTNRGAAGATGTVYYIDAVNGSDSNTGTSQAQAWQTTKNINALSSSSASFGGCAFLFRAGQTFTAPSGTQTLVCQPGSPCARAIYGSYDPAGTGIGQATIQAPGGANQPLSMAIVPADWTEIRDLNVVGTSVQGNYYSCADNTAGQWLIEGTAQDVLIENLTIYDGVCGIDAVSSLFQDQSARWAIYDTTIYNIGGTGIYVYGDNFTVRNCLVRDWEQQGETNSWFSQGAWTASQHGIYSRARQLEVYGSEFYRYSATLDTSGQAISTRGRDNVVEGNRIHDLAESAIGYFPDSSDFDRYWGCGTSVFRYNTFWNIGYSTIRGGVIFYAATNGGVMNEHWVAYNNTCHGVSTIGSTTAIEWTNLTNGATDRNNAVTGSFTQTSVGPSSGAYASDHNAVGSAAALVLPAPPALGSTSVEWVPEPGAGSSLLGGGAASVDTGYLILFPSPPDIGSE